MSIQKHNLDNQKRTEDQDFQKERKKNSFFAFFFLCFIVAGIAGFAYVKRENIGINDFNWKGLFTGDAFYTKIPETQLISEIKFDASLGNTYAIMKNNLLECSNNGIRILNEKGKELFNDPISMNSPVIKAAGEFTVVYDAGGKLIQVFRKGQKSWSKETGQAILNADISDSGYLAVVHDEERYRSGATIYNSQGMEVFRVGRVEKNLISARISPSGKHIIYTSLDVNGVSVNTELEFSDIYGKLSPDRWKKEGAMFPFSKFIDDDLALVGDSGAALIGANQKEKWYKPISGKIFSATTMADEYLVLALSHDEGNGRYSNTASDIHLINSSGKDKIIGKVDDSIKNIQTYQSVIGLNTGKIVYFMDTSGDIESRFIAPQEVSDVLMLNASQAFVVGRSSVYFVEYD